MRLTLILMLINIIGYTQTKTDKEQVVEAINNYVDAFYLGDTTKIHQSISPSVVKYGFYVPKGKTEYVGEPMTFKEMIDYSKGVMERGPNAKVSGFPRGIEVFDVLDQTASGRLTAWWGVDFILLSKHKETWLITHVVWQSNPIKK
jgi:Putative lumazine-binding